MKDNEKKRQSGTYQLSRREFIGRSALAVGAVTILPRHVLGGNGFTPPSDKLNIACIGAGGKGVSDIRAVSTENLVAFCDVDDVRAAETYTAFPKVPRYKDFRIMLDENDSDIDAVTVSTPDHIHTIAAMTAIKMGKHVFVQKPLTHTVKEARMLAEAAKEEGIVSQMGNQGHAGEGARLINEWIWDGAIGDVSEVHTWTNRPIWPQNIEKPEAIPSVPPTLDWNLWLGPAPWRNYHPAYVPFSWRGWWDFGTGALGDMGAHIIDHPYWALDLGYPDTVQASSTEFNEETYPLASVITYTFPARGDKPPVKFKWFDGGIMPPRPEELEQGRMMGEKGGGVIFIGSKGKLMCSVYGENPRLIPETKMQAYKRPEKSIPRSPGIHQEWVAACKGEGKTTSHFGYAGKLTEMMLLGNIAIRLQDQKMIFEWDGPNMRFKNSEEANKHLQTEYRQGWTL
jgi:predicted dehydrogenase